MSNTGESPDDSPEKKEADRVRKEQSRRRYLVEQKKRISDWRNLESSSPNQEHSF